MSTHAILCIVALVASLLLLQGSSRTAAVVAAIVAGIEVVLALGLVSLSVKGLPLGLILALALCAAGVLCWMRSGGKTAVSAATVVSLIGAVQVVQALGIF